MGTRSIQNPNHRGKASAATGHYGYENAIRLSWRDTKPLSLHERIEAAIEENMRFIVCFPCMDFCGKC